MPNTARIYWAVREPSVECKTSEELAEFDAFLPFSPYRSFGCVAYRCTGCGSIWECHYSEPSRRAATLHKAWYNARHCCGKTKREYLE